jgi:hypothetical protein
MHPASAVVSVLVEDLNADQDFGGDLRLEGRGAPVTELLGLVNLNGWVLAPRLNRP